MVKVGDRVRFLNSVGGGIVKKINKDIALMSFLSRVYLGRATRLVKTPFY